MLLRQAVKYLIVFITIIKCVYSFEAFFSKTKDDKDQTIEPLERFHNKSYQIPLFKTHYITIRAHLNDFQRNKNVIGYKFQLRSTRPEVIKIRKELMIPTKDETINTILLEDLYILRRTKALNQILNAYPSPTLIHVNTKPTNGSKIDTTWSIEGATMDMTNLIIRLDIFYDDDTSVSHIWSLNILVIQPKRRVDTIFFIIIPFMVIGISILMGILLDTSVIAGIAKKPTPVLVGFLAQYGLMPFLAMAIAKLFQYTTLNSLALFVIGCCPGSGASNQWTVIFNGDVNLSAIMSFVSTTASFFMMPLYFYTLGKLYTDELSINVPFFELARTLAFVVIPYSIGIIISHKCPKSRPFVKKLIKPIMIALLLFFTTFGIVVNYYLFLMIDLYTLLTAPLLPFLGFILGAIIAWACRMSWEHIKTIGIEAGIQNTGIAFMIIMYSFPQPYATQAIIVPMVVAFFSTKPFWIILIIRNQVAKYKKKKLAKKSNNINGELIKSNDKSSLNNEENNNCKLSLNNEVDNDNTTDNDT